MGISSDLEAGAVSELPAGRAEVQEAARAAAKGAGGWSFTGGVVGYFRVSEVQAAEHVLTFAISALSGRRLLLFHVFHHQAGSGGTAVRVAIGDHLQTQARTFGVPADRWRIAGFGSYVKFVSAFSAALENLAWPKRRG